MTRWSMVGSAQSDDPAALAELCKTYWYPLYCYARRICRNRDDASDLTQGFFEMLLKRQALKAACAERGKMRTFLLTALKNHAAEEFRNGRALKRGGGVPVIAFDALTAEQRFALEPRDDLSPEREFDRAWARQLLSSVLAKLGEAYREAGKGEVFEALRDHLTGGDTEGYTAAAESLDLSAASVRYAAFKLRERYRAMLREAIQETVSTEEETAEEMAHLRSLFSD